MGIIDDNDPYFIKLEPGDIVEFYTFKFPEVKRKIVKTMTNDTKIAYYVNTEGYGFEYVKKKE